MIRIIIPLICIAAVATATPLYSLGHIPFLANTIICSVCTIVSLICAIVAVREIKQGKTRKQESK